MNYEVEKNALLEIQKQLQSELDTMIEEEYFKRTQSHADKELLYGRLPIYYLKSVYHTKKDELFQYATMSFSDAALLNISIVLEETCEKQRVEYFVMYVEEVLETEDTVTLYLKDPYRAVKTNPIKKTAISNRGKNLKKHMVKVKTMFPGMIFELGIMEVMKIEVLPYSLSGVYISSDSENDRQIKTADYDELDYMANLTSKEICKQAALEYAEEKKEMGGICGVIISESHDECILVREEYKETYLVIGEKLECITRDTYALSEAERKKYQMKLSAGEGIDLVDEDIKRLLYKHP